MWRLRSGIKGVEDKTNFIQRGQDLLGPEPTAGYQFLVFIIAISWKGGASKEEITSGNVEEVAARTRMNLTTRYRTMKNHDR